MKGNDTWEEVDLNELREEIRYLLSDEPDRPLTILEIVDELCTATAHNPAKHWAVDHCPSDWEREHFKRYAHRMLGFGYSPWYVHAALKNGTFRKFAVGNREYWGVMV